MSTEQAATVPSDEAIITAMDADAAGVPITDAKRPTFHFLPEVEIEVEEKDAVTGKSMKVKKTIRQAATFIAMNENGRISASYKVTLWQPTDLITQRGVRPAAGTGFVVAFVDGKYSTPFVEVAEEMQGLPDFMTHYRPNVADPTGYWRARGVIEMKEKVEVVPVIVGNQPKVKRGARSTIDQPGKET